MKDTDTYCLVLHSEERGYLNYISFNDKGEARFFDWHEGFWGLYPGSTRLHFDEIIFKGEKSDRVFTGDAAFVNELSGIIKEKTEIGKMDCFEKINDEYPPQKLPEILYVRQPDKTTIWQGGNKFDFNEVYGVGDIVFVKGMPFYYPEYCVMLEDMMCAFISMYGFVRIGSFKDGVYCDTSQRNDKFADIVLCSERVGNVPPEEYNSMKELSDMIKAEPKLAKTLLDMDLKNNDYAPEQVVELMKKTINNKT